MATVRHFDAPAIGQGFDGVFQQVEQDLLEHVGIGLHLAWRVLHARDHLDLRRQEVGGAEQSQYIVDHAGAIGHAAGGHRLQIGQAADQLPDPVDLFVQDSHLAADRLLFLQLVIEHAQIVLDDG